MNGEVIGRSENAPLSKLSNIPEVLRYRSSCGHFNEHLYDCLNGPCLKTASYTRVTRLPSLQAGVGPSSSWIRVRTRREMDLPNGINKGIRRV
jgi:hypothetical protein